MFFSASSTSDKIHAKKMAVGYSEPPKPLSAIEDFCERFDKAVKNTFPKGAMLEFHLPRPEQMKFDGSAKNFQAFISSFKCNIADKVADPSFK